MREFTRAIIDFIQYAFLLSLIVFAIIFIILGDRLWIFTSIARALIPVSYFGVVLLAFGRLQKEKVDKIRKEDRINDIIMYFTRGDKIKDLAVIISLPVIILVIAAYDQLVMVIDFIQASAALAVMLVWHYLLFMEKEGTPGLMYLTNFDKVKDQVVIFLLPVLVIAVSAIFEDITLVDSLQALITFLVVYAWHKFLFRNAKD